VIKAGWCIQMKDDSKGYPDKKIEDEIIKKTKSIDDFLSHFKGFEEMLNNFTEDADRE